MAIIPYGMRDELLREVLVPDAVLFMELFLRGCTGELLMLACGSKEEQEQGKGQR